MVPAAALFVYWSASSLAVFTYAGEKMPWLTIHITLSMILSTAWGIGWIIETIPWGRLVILDVAEFMPVVSLWPSFGLLAVITARFSLWAALHQL